MAGLVLGGMSVDCPHRERLGYLGDAHTSLETALDNVASDRFYSKWLNDIIDIQGSQLTVRALQTQVAT